MNIDNGCESLICPHCESIGLKITNELFFGSEHLNVNFKCFDCGKEYYRCFEALYARFEENDKCPELPEDEFNLNEDGEDLGFEIDCCFKCKSKDLSPSEDPFFGENYVSESFACDDCGLEVYVEFYDSDGYELIEESNSVDTE